MCLSGRVSSRKCAENVGFDLSFPVDREEWPNTNMSLKVICTSRERESSYRQGESVIKRADVATAVLADQGCARADVNDVVL